MKPSPKTLQIFLAEGTPSGIQVAELTTRIIQAVSIPRTRLQAFFERNKEVNHVGTYFLFGAQDDASKPKTYIGQTEDLRERLKQHDADPKKEFWTTAVVLISRTDSFTQAHIRWLEWYSIQQTKFANRFHLENGNGGSEPHVTEAIRADLFEIFETGALLIQSLGHPIFEPLLKRSAGEESSDAVVYWYCKGPDANAIGTMTSDGFVVLKGSKCRKQFTPGAVDSSFARKREAMINAGILKLENDSYIFTEDYLLNSPSRSAAIILGRHSNGWQCWTDANGKTLDEVKRKG
jgi:hypothetical protein